MEQFQLMFDHIIPKLENENQWKSVADIVFQQWQDCPDDLNRLLCAGTQLWYTLLMMDYIKNDPFPPGNVELVSNTQLQNNLATVTRYGFKHFANSSIFNAYFGYMISVMPYFFLDYNGDYAHWKSKGIEMMRYSYSLDPNSPFTKAMYYEPEGFGKDTPFYNACKEIWSIITPEQWGDSEVQQYFFRILHGNSFHNL